MNLIGALAVVSSVAAFWATHRQLKGRSFSTRATALGVSALLSIPALLFPLYYLHVLPEMAWFYTMRSWSGSEFLAVFLGAAGGAFAALLPRWLLLLPLFLTICAAVVPYLKPIMVPLPAGAFKETWEGESCLQSTPSTCGPASTATILKSLGVYATERGIAEAAFTCASGTEAWYLARYVRSRGLDARFDFEPTFSPSGTFPAMVGVRAGGSGHFIAVLDVSDGHVTFVDPLHGKERLETAGFLRRYSFTGFHMVVTKS